MKNKNLALLKQFIEEQHFLYKTEIEEATLLERDLRITGDDAVEFILAFAKRFNVDVSNFKMDEYFEAEGILGPFFSFFYKHIKSPSKKELTVGSLLDAMENHVLDP